MAVTRVMDVIKLGAAGDIFQGETPLRIQAIGLDHTAAANAFVTLADGTTPIANLRLVTNELTKVIHFPFGLIVPSVKAQTLSAGTIYIYLG